MTTTSTRLKCGLVARYITKAELARQHRDERRNSQRGEQLELEEPK